MERCEWPFSVRNRQAGWVTCAVRTWPTGDVHWGAYGHRVCGTWCLLRPPRDSLSVALSALSASFLTLSLSLSLLSQSFLSLRLLVAVPSRVFETFLLVFFFFFHSVCYFDHSSRVEVMSVCVSCGRRRGCGLLA
eukprot:Opistho-2@36765